jgi:hypothetical protein
LENEQIEIKGGMKREIGMIGILHTSNVPVTLELACQCQGFLSSRVEEPPEIRKNDK